MVFKEFGIENKDAIILLHGGGLSWWNYIDEINMLKNDYHLIIPILDGHSGSDKDFVSIEDNTGEIIKFIDDNFNGKVKFIGGLSLGAQILLEILSQRDNICDYAIIESALIYPMKMTYKMIEPSFNMSYNLIKKKWFSKLQFKSLKMKDSLFNNYYEDTCNITKSNLISFMKSNADYKVKDGLLNCKTKTLVLVGSKERPIMKKSADKIHEMIPNSDLKILKGYYHGDISINHGDEYVDLINNILK